MIETPQPPLAPVQPKRNSLMGALIVLIILLLAAAGYLGYQNIQLQSQIAALKIIPTPLVSPKPTATEDTTANWNTYTSEKFGFSIQYPSDAKITTRDPDPYPVVVQIEDLQPRTGGGGPAVEGWFLTISETQPNPKNLTLPQWAKENTLISSSPESYQSSPENIIIGGQTALHWTTSGGDAALSYYLLKRNQGVTLILVNPSTLRSPIDQILSTFRFLDQNVSSQIPGWKNYSNNDFTFQYPGDWTIDSGGRIILAETSGASIVLFDKSTPMYNECMKLDKTEIVGVKMVKYYSYAYSGEACSNQGNIGNYEAWITKAGGEGFQPGIIYMYNTKAYPKSLNIFQQILSTFAFAK